MDAMGMTTFFIFLNLDNWDMILFSKSCRGQIARGCEDVTDTNHGGEAQNDQQNSKGYGFRTCKHVESMYPKNMVMKFRVIVQ